MDLLLYQRGSFQLIEHRYQRDDIRQISNWWQQKMRLAVEELPSEWVESAFSKLRDTERPSTPKPTRADSG